MAVLAFGSRVLACGTREIGVRCLFFFTWKSTAKCSSFEKKNPNIADSAVVAVPSQLGKCKVDEGAVVSKGYFSLTEAECITNLLHHLKREEG